MTRPLTRRGFLAGLVAAPVAVPAVAKAVMAEPIITRVPNTAFVTRWEYDYLSPEADGWTRIDIDDVRKVSRTWHALLDHDGAPAAPAAGGEQPSVGQGGGVPPIPSGAPS